MVLSTYSDWPLVALYCALAASVVLAALSMGVVMCADRYRGPDWMDAGAIVNALCNLHKCTVSIELMPGGTPVAPCLDIYIISTWESLEVGRRPSFLVTKHGPLPYSYTEAAARVFGALNEHDKEISARMYTQQDFKQA